MKGYGSGCGLEGSLSGVRTSSTKPYLRPMACTSNTSFYVSKSGFFGAHGFGPRLHLLRHPYGNEMHDHHVNPKAKQTKTLNP